MRRKNSHLNWRAKLSIKILMSENICYISWCADKLKVTIFCQKQCTRRTPTATPWQHQSPRSSLWWILENNCFVNWQRGLADLVPVENKFAMIEVVGTRNVVDGVHGAIRMRNVVDGVDGAISVSYRQWRQRPREQREREDGDYIGVYRIISIIKYIKIEKGQRGKFISLKRCRPEILF